MFCCGFFCAIWYLYHDREMSKQPQNQHGRRWPKAVWVKLRKLYHLTTSITTWGMRFSLSSFLIICSLSHSFASVLNIKSNAKSTKICQGTKGGTKSSQHFTIHFILQWTRHNFCQILCSACKLKGSSNVQFQAS